MIVDAHAPPSGPATLALRPERIRLLSAAAPSSADLGELACLQTTVAEVHYLGTDTRYHLVSGGEVLSVQQQNLGGAGGFRVGDEVLAVWQPAGASLLP